MPTATTEAPVLALAGIGSASTAKSYQGRIISASTGYLPLEATIKAVLAQYTLPNTRLLVLAEKNKPPQSWYEEDMKGLY